MIKLLTVPALVVVGGLLVCGLLYFSKQYEEKPGTLFPSFFATPTPPEATASATPTK